MRRRSLLLVFCAVLCPAQTPLADLVSVIGGEVRQETAMRHMRAVWETDRWFTFPKFHETAASLRQILTDAKLSQVEILHAPADGVSQAGYWTMPLAWDARAGRLEIAEPAVEPELRVLADYREIPSSLCMWSGPTPREGITAELVEHPAPPEALRGKLVLTRRNPAGLKWQLARHGAAGAINAFTENPDLRDGRQWVNAWGDNGWAFTQGSAPLPCFSITPRQAELLASLRKKHGRVVLKAVADTRYYKDTYPYTTAVLPGAGREEVLVLGHTAEQGAHDNATGVAAMVEALAALNRLIGAGKLPRPARSIRFLAMGELYASMHYVREFPERIRHTVAAFCVDTPAAAYELPGTEYTFYLNPHAARSYADALVLHLASLYFPRVNRPYHWRPFMPGTDTFLADPMIGIATVWPYSGTGVQTHHNSEDKPETVDPRSLRDLTVITAAYLYAIAAAGADDAVRFGGLAAEFGREQILNAASKGSRAGVDYQLERELEAVRSVTRLAAVQDQIAPLLEGLRAAAAPLQRVLPAVKDKPDAEAARTIVRRKRFGTLPLDDIAPDQREGFPSGAWDTRLITALYWCDGKRSIADVVRLTELELGPREFDWMGYFRFLARKGYVELVTAHP